MGARRGGTESTIADTRDDTRDDTHDPERTQLEDDVDVTEDVPVLHCDTRGLNVRAALDWVRNTHGKDGVAAVTSSLAPEDLRALGLERGALPAGFSWVPFLAHARMLVVIDVVFGASDLALLRTVGRHMGAHDFPGVVKPALRLMSPSFFVEKAMSLWPLYHSHGRWEVVSAANDAKAMLVEHPEHHPAFCATFCGWLEGAVSLTGAKLIETEETRCAARGAPACTFHARWSSGISSARDRVPRPPS